MAAPKGKEPVLVLRLQIVDYTGVQNRAGVTAMAHFISKATGQDLFREKVRAQLRYDQGALLAVLRKLPRSTATLVMDRW
ncbi:MAG: hypothetical protein L0312_27700 [Acidobacteria bacterium]|nr:hypothetical protein [Acidobacteriota bacterium]